MAAYDNLPKDDLIAMIVEIDEIARDHLRSARAFARAAARDGLVSIERTLDCPKLCPAVYVEEWPRLEAMSKPELIAALAEIDHHVRDHLKSARSFASAAASDGLYGLESILDRIIPEEPDNDADQAPSSPRP